VSIDVPGVREVASPRAEYSRRLNERLLRLQRLAVRERTFGLGRVAVFLAGLGVAWAAFGSRLLSGWWIAAPLGVFLLLLIVHEKAQRAWRRCQRAAAFYETGLGRLDERWHGQGNSGARYLDLKHPCAADLDLFGTASLFERLCRARTRAGEDCLAGWLNQASVGPEIRARQAAVAELRNLLDFREDLACAGAVLPSGTDLHDVATWGRAEPILIARWPRLVALLLGLATVSTALDWVFGQGSAWPFLVLVLVELVFTLPQRGRVERVLQVVERRAHDLALLAQLLAAIERQAFSAPRLQHLRGHLLHEPHAGRTVSPSQAIAVLANWIELLQSRRNQLFMPIACLLMWGTQLAYSLEAWRLRHGAAIGTWIDVVGQMEALASLAGYAYEHPADPFPEIVDDAPACFDGEALGHPLLPVDRCVRNDMRLVEGLQILVVSGSNMSGKSTFLRTAGVNAVLALAGGPVRARRLRLTPLVVGATLRIQDSLQAGVSRFYAELLRVRQIVALSRGSPPLLFLLDELFAGTNSHDRRIGAEAVVRGLVDAGALGLVTTHDLALTQVTDKLGPRAANVHFADHFENGAMVFDYRLRPGVVQHSNALALMRAVGLDV
jgi:hypothetical protein